MPNRLIKESICTSDTINELTWMQEVCFYRLITVCDDFGRMDARPQILKGRMFPLREDLRSGEILKALNALEDAGLIRRYTVGGKPFLQVLTWEHHQQIRAKVSRYPGPENADMISDDIKCDHMISDDIKCNQMISDDIKCARNPIQSNPNPNPNPGERARARFAAFWDAYPKKVGKGAAEKAFERCHVTDELLRRMLDAIASAKQTAQWRDENGRFIPNPATWLNQKRWDDDPKSLMTGGNSVSAQRYTQREYDDRELEERLGVNDLFRAEG